MWNSSAPNFAAGSPGWELTAEKIWKNGMAATYVKVKTGGPAKASLARRDSRVLQKSQLAPQARERAAAIFTKLGEAEARVHDVPLEKIHFHEVGAVDAIVDIVALASAFTRSALINLPVRR